MCHCCKGRPDASHNAMWFIGKLIGDFAIPISQFFSKVLGWVFVPLWVAVLADVFRHVPS